MCFLVELRKWQPSERQEAQPFLFGVDYLGWLSFFYFKGIYMRQTKLKTNKLKRKHMLKSTLVLIGVVFVIALLISAAASVTNDQAEQEAARQAQQQQLQEQAEKEAAAAAHEEEMKQKLEFLECQIAAEEAFTAAQSQIPTGYSTAEHIQMLHTLEQKRSTDLTNCDRQSSIN
jgi:Tfp pilus assembly protein PilO